MILAGVILQRIPEAFYDDVTLSWQRFRLALRKYMKQNTMMSLPSFNKTSLSRIEPKISGITKNVLLLLTHTEPFDPSCIATLLLLHHVANNENPALCCYTLYHIDNNDNPVET